MAAAAFLGLSAVAGDGFWFVVNEDNDHFFKCDTSQMTRQGLEEYVDYVARGHVTHIFWCVCGQRPSYDSKTWEPIWEGMNERARSDTATWPDGTHDRWCVNAKKLFDDGIDPYEVWIARCRAKGVSPWVSMRMNDVHFGADTNYFRNTRFFKAHPEWQIVPNSGKDGWQRWQLDYARPEVRAHHMAQLKEIAARWDADGLELDWMRFGQAFRPGHEREDAHHLDAFMREARQAVRAAGAARGRSMQLAVRVPATPEKCEALGFNVLAWVRAGLVDVVIPDGFLEIVPDLPVGRWLGLLKGSGVRLVPGTGSSVPKGKTRREMPSIYRELAASFRRQGATGAYFFNLPYLSNEKYSTDGIGGEPYDVAEDLYVGGLEPGRLPPMAGGDVNYRPMRVFDDAAWVWTEESGGSSFFRLRRDFDSDGSPLDLYVSADERYVLMLDGEELSRGPARGMASHWFCQRVRAQPRPGKRRLEAVVWTLGEDAPRAQLSHGGGFFLKAIGAYDACLTTGKARWQVAPLRGTATNGRTYPASFGCGTQFRVSGTSVLDEQPPAGAWRDAIPVSDRPKMAIDGWGIVPPGRCVYASILPEMMLRTIRPGEIPKAALYVPAGTKREWLFDLGDYYCAYPYLTVAGGKGAKIRLGFSECLVGKDGKKIHRDARDGQFTQAYFDTFLPDGRERAVFTVPWWRCGKWCKLEVETADESLVLEDVALKETRYPIAVDGSFAAEGDATLAPIARMCGRGLEMCAHEIMFDCPFYEQQMYPGDILMSFAALRAMTRDLRLPLQSLELFDAARMPSGLVPMNWPSRIDQRGTTWTLSWVAAIGEIALWGGAENRDWLCDRFPGVTHTLMSYARIENESGLLVDPPGWNFLDWTKGWEKSCNTPPNGLPGKGPDACINLLYLQAMERTSHLAAAIGETEQATYWRNRAVRLAAGIRATFWDETRGMVADTPEKTSFSEHAVSLSITTDCLPPDMRDRSFRALVTASDLSRASYMLHMVFAACFRYGRGDLFLGKLDPWRGYLKLGLRCPLESPEFPRSDCHAFASVPLFHFHAGLAGVRPMAPFFARVLVKPSPGGLASLHAKTPHPRGIVETDLAFDGSRAKGAVVLPSGVDGVFSWAGRDVPLVSGVNAIDIAGGQ